MKRFFLFIHFSVFLYFLGYSQGDIVLENKLLYRNERSYSFFITSTGWGFNGRHAIHLNAADKKIYDIDFSIIKHPQEYRQSDSYGSSLSSFVYGKNNIVFDLRYGIGRQKEIFRKFDVGGVSIRKFYSIGASLALLKPIYYEVNYEVLGLKVQKFKEIRFDTIKFELSRASFFKGFGEIKPVPGAFVKAGMCFEFGSKDKVLNAIEAGGILEAFLLKLDMMDTKNNYRFFLSLFVSYRFGKVFDSKTPKVKRKEDYFY